MERGPRRAERAAFLSLSVTVLLAVLKFGVWRATGSLAVLSQALDSLVDLVALGVVYVGVRVASKPADETHHYGHGKAENLAAFGQTVLIGAVVLGVAWEAVRRLVAGDGAEVSAPWYALTLLVLTIVVDAARVAYLTRTARTQDSEALRAGALNIAGDLGTAVVALASLFLVRAGFGAADPIGALIVVSVVGAVAISLAKRSIDVLMDRAPTQKVRAIEDAAARVPGVQEARRVRLRGSTGSLFADVTVAAGRTASLERAHVIAESVERAIERVAPGTDVVVHVEPTEELGSLVERVQAAAGRSGAVHEVHNVLVHAFDEAGLGKLHVTLHAKVRGGMSLDQAHALSERIEQEVLDELEMEARVDTHLEPLQPTTRGSDVTASRPDLLGTLIQLTRQEPDILDCHDVMITDAGGEVAMVAHVTGLASIQLDRIHGAATRVENALRARHPEVTSVVLHLEPPGGADA